MKIFFYIHTLKPGGAEKQCSMIAAALKKRYGFESVVILNWDDDAKPEFVKCLLDVNVELTILPKNPIIRLIRLWMIFRSDRDAVLYNYLTYPDFVGGLIARIAGLRHIVGGIETDRMFGVKFIAEKIAHRYLSERTICNSYRALHFFEARGFDKSKMVVMPSAIEMLSDQDLACKKTAVEQDEFVYIITIGRFVPAKDYETWINTIGELYRHERNIRAIIIGYGELEQRVREQINKKKLTEIITILPGQSTDVRTELLKSDIYFSSSAREGTSNTILEAMDAGLPVVATNVGDNSRMVEDGKSGFLCEKGDVRGLAEKLRLLVDNKILRCQFGTNAREILKEKYSLEKISSDYHSLSMSMLQR